MFTGLAGAGIEQWLRFLANGKFLAMLTLLLIEGLLHYVLVPKFDVLMSYAVTSMRVDRHRRTAWHPQV